MSRLKRRPCVGRGGQLLHERWSKSTIHEALLDLWMESKGLDCHPDDLTERQWAEYAEDIESRSLLKQGSS